MLSPDDARIVAREPEIPGMRLVLDREALGETLARAVPSVRLEALEIQYVRYKPGANCLAAGVLRVEGSPVWVACKAHRSRSVEKLAKPLQKPGVPGPLGPGRVVLRDQALVVSVFPNDGKVRGPARLTRDDGWRRLLRAAGIHEHRSRASVHLLRYNPERRAISRLEWDGRDTAVLRSYRDGDFRRTLGVMATLERLNNPLIPRRLGWISGAATIALQWMPGEPLQRRMNAGLASAGELRTIADALAALHALDGAGLSRRDGPGDAARLLALADDLAAIVPSQAARGRDLAARLGAWLASQDSGQTVLHGDLHAGQIAVSPAGVGLLDFDEACAGDPAFDLANLRAHLEADVAAGRLRRHDAEEATGILLDEYASASGHPIPPTLDRLTACALVRLAPHPFRQRREGWADQIAALIDAADRLSATPDAVRIRPPAVCQGTGVFRRDRALAFLRSAVDPVAAVEPLRAALAAVLPAAPLRIRQIEVLHHKPGRRAVLGYDLEAGSVTLALIGKLRAKGVDRTTHALLSRLRALGLDGRDGVAVPEPLGLVPEFHMSLTRRIQGRNLLTALERPGAGTLASRVADALVRLHADAVPVPRQRHALEDELGILDRRLVRLADTRTDLAPRLRAVSAACHDLAARIPAHRETGVHRDFHPGQVLVAFGQVHLLDFDLYCPGDPALDAGNFVAHLEEHALRVHGRVEAMATPARAFVARYCAATGTPPSVVRAYAALSLARLVQIASERPGRAHAIEVLLSHVEASVDLRPAGVVS